MKAGHYPPHPPPSASLHELAAWHAQARAWWREVATWAKPRTTERRNRLAWAAQHEARVVALAWAAHNALIDSKKKGNSTMNRYAVINTFSGYVLGAVNADSPQAACTAVDAEAGGRPELGAYDYAPAYEVSAYDVRRAPLGFAVEDGQCANSIAVVKALPRVGMFAWKAAE